MFYMVKDMRDSSTSITRLSDKSIDYGLMHVMAVQIIYKRAILFILKHNIYLSVLFLISVVDFGASHLF